MTGVVRPVIFACVHNAGRSQMAAAFFDRACDLARVRAISAGTEPAARVHPEVVVVMREFGIDLSDAQPRLLTLDLARDARMLVTLGCGERCPVVPGLEVLDWLLPDPKGQGVEAVRAIRDEVQRRVDALLDARGWRALA
jgi:arsenate reductase